MRMLPSLTFLALTLSATLAAEPVSSVVVSNRQEPAFAVTASIRTNGCKLELFRYTKDKPHMQGYWIQHLYVGEEPLLLIQRSAIDKEQTLIIDPARNYAVLQMDLNFDGKYEMFLVESIKDKTLIDVLYVTEEGWLRHSTRDEFQARLRIAQTNRKQLEELDKTVRDAFQKANEKRER